PHTDDPLYAQFDSEHTQVAAGVAIFHLKSERVVVCYHSRDEYWFLPKGRKDAGESVERAACREGFEESGYRNRLLPIPQKHRQPAPAAPLPTGSIGPFTTEAVWMQFAPNGRRTQYILFWYIAETIPPDDVPLSDELQLHSSTTPYIHPPPFPPDLKLEERLAQDPVDYVPQRHEGTGVDEEEAQYQSSLLPIAEAMEKLALTSNVMVDVVRRGWEGVLLRRDIEE
ncbi:hypothetical protein NA57DRAFT_26349, partial [Rhizodiscina lignyota]